MADEKVDLFKIHKAEYKAGREPAVVTTSEAMYLAVAGCGAPGSEDFSVAITALYGMVYTIKMGRKAEQKGDYTIGKLECLYWNEDGSPLDAASMEKWCWRLMIRTPEIVGRYPITDEDLETAKKRLLERKKGEGCERIFIDRQTGGACVQLLHIGPYDQEQESLDLIQKYCEKNQLEPCGRHHEIYLSDPRRVKPENLKTILRVRIQ